MMQEIMDQEERVMLDQIAKLTEENHVEWACDEYNPIGFLDKDDDSEQSACICQMFQFSGDRRKFCVKANSRHPFRQECEQKPQTDGKDVSIWKRPRMNC